MEAYKDKYFIDGKLNERIFFYLKYSNIENVPEKVDNDVLSICIKNNLLYHEVAIQLGKSAEDFLDDVTTVMIILTKTISDDKNNIEKDQTYEEVNFHGFKYLRTGQYEERKQITLEV